MSIVERLSKLLRANIPWVESPSESPAETLDRTHEDMKAHVREIRASKNEIRSHRVALMERADDLRDEISRYDDQARKALSQGREGRAEDFFAKRQRRMAARNDIQSQVQELHGMEETLHDRYVALRRKVYKFETEKETLKARHRKAKAENSVQSTLLGIDEAGRILEHSTGRPAD